MTPAASLSDVQRAEQAIATLREMSADEIAAYLGAAGFKGSPCNDSACPVAEYLAHATGNERVSVTNSSAVAYELTRGDLNRLWRVEYNHTTLAQFINKFDRGDYPDLVAHA